jgi:hypothetical protein
MSRCHQIVRLADGYDTLADAAAIDDWASLLAILLAQPDADTALDQMPRVAWQITRGGKGETISLIRLIIMRYRL